MDSGVYHEQLMRWYRESRTRGSIEKPTFSGSQKNALCGDTVTIAGVVKNGIVVECKYTGAGCIISQAAASCLADWVVGKRIKQVKTVTVEDLLARLGIELGPVRQECVTVAINALLVALAERA